MSYDGPEIKHLHCPKCGKKLNCLLYYENIKTNCPRCGSKIISEVKNPMEQWILLKDKSMFV